MLKFGDISKWSVASRRTLAIVLIFPMIITCLFRCAKDSASALISSVSANFSDLMELFSSLWDKDPWYAAKPPKTTESDKEIWDQINAQ